jgi:tRNA G18 (ribose-2'-O)-methylase SpoU
VLIAVEDPDDPRIEPYRAVRERDLAGREGRFVAEGEVVLRVLLTGSRFLAESVLVSQKRAAALESLLARVPPGVPVYVAPQAVMVGIVGFPIHRGLLAIGRRGPARSAAELLSTLPPTAIVLGLVGLANHDNVGGIFRNAAAFGADAVLLDETSCDPLYRKAIRVSVGAALTIPFARGGPGGEMLDALTEAGFEALALTPAGAEPLSVLRRAPRTALLLGAEGPGLPPEVLARTRTVRIPMADGFDSLNVATASGIALHHLMHVAPASLSRPGRGPTRAKPERGEGPPSS